MKRSYKLEELGCANCAQKMERAIGQIEGVDRVNINFLTCKLKIEAAEKDFENILKKAQEEISKIERDCKIVF